MNEHEPIGTKGLFYDTIADRFDAIMNRYDVERRLEIVFGELLAAEDLAGLSLLDVGCGTGWFTQRAASRGARVVALDVSVKLLQRTREKCDVTLVASDACRLPFPDGAFDIVISSECIEHTAHPIRAVAEMCRVLKPRGTLVVTVPNRVWHWSATFASVFKLRPYEGLENWVSWWELRRALRGHGMTIVHMRGFHLFPPVLRVTWPMLRPLDRLGPAIGPVMLNIAVKAVK